MRALRRILSFILVLCMMVGMFPRITLFAGAEETETAGYEASVKETVASNVVFEVEKPSDPIITEESETPAVEEEEKAASETVEGVSTEKEAEVIDSDAVALASTSVVFPAAHGSFGGHNYYLFTEYDFTWDEAVAYCESLGGIWQRSPVRKKMTICIR